MTLPFTFDFIYIRYNFYYYRKRNFDTVAKYYFRDFLNLFTYLRR